MTCVTGTKGRNAWRNSDWLALPQFFFLYWQDPRRLGTSSPVQFTLPIASIVRPGKLEIPTANIAITSSGLNGDSEAVGTARSTMLATLTLVIFRENAAVMRGAKYYFRQMCSETRDRNPAPRMGRPHDSRRATPGGPPVRSDLRALMWACALGASAAESTSGSAFPIR